MPVLPREIAPALGELCRTYRACPHDFIVCEGTPDQYDASAPCSLIVQGELQEQPGGWYFYFTHSKLPMRAALAKHGQHAFGLGARDYLRRVCTEDAFSDLEDLLSSHPGHIIELSVFTRALGIYPHRNVVVWEVREY